MDKNYIVTQSNKLVEAKQKVPLSMREQKLILTMISMIQPKDQDFKEYRISVKEFSEMLDLKAVKYTAIKEIVKGLMSKVIEIPNESGGWLLVHWLSSAEYIDGQGEIALAFSPKLKPYLLELQNQYTQYKLEIILGLDSGYSIRLYELLRQWHGIGHWECNVDLLREKVGAITKSYSLYSNFKNKVLLHAITEINEKTDLKISFEEIKKGRKIDSIKFKINLTSRKALKLSANENKPEQQKKTDNFEELRQKLNSLTQGYEFDSIYFIDLYKTMTLVFPGREEEELTFLIDYINKEKNINSPLGFIKSKLKAAFEIVKVIGVDFSFSSLKETQKRNSREEIIPEWFEKRDSESYYKEKENDEEDIDKKREELIRELQKMGR